MLTIFIRSILLYAVMLLTLRGMGKHQLGQFQPFEFAMAILIADLMATPMGDISTPLIHGVLPVAALFILHCLLTFICLKSDKMRAIISGKPAVVVSRGVIDQKELQKLCMSLSDLLEGMREAGIIDPAALDTAVVEADGKISAFDNKVTRGNGMPLPLILDGRVQQNNLLQAHKDGAWLSELLGRYALTEERVLLMSLASTGAVHLQDKNGTVMQLQPFSPPAEVSP